MTTWLLKTEPSTYSFEDLAKAKRAVWDGVKNPVAIKHIKAMKPGDRALIYHTGDEKAVVGVAEVASAARPDPNDEKLSVIDLVAKTPLPQPVTLAQLKAEASFKDSPLVKMGRLSVVPLDDAQWKRLSELAGAKR